MLLTKVGTLEGEKLGRREGKVSGSVISFAPEALARNPSRNAQKASEHVGLEKETCAEPECIHPTWPQQDPDPGGSRLQEKAPE